MGTVLTIHQFTASRLGLATTMRLNATLKQSALARPASPVCLKCDHVIFEYKPQGKSAMLRLEAT